MFEETNPTLSQCEDEYEIYNCHVHLFTSKHAPQWMYTVIPFFTSIGFATKPVVRWLLSLLDGRVSVTSPLQKLVNFARIGTEVDAEGVLKRMLPAYPDNARFVALSIDMDQMKPMWWLPRGFSVPKKFDEQLDELIQLAKNPDYVGRIYVFAGVDPRRLKKDSGFWSGLVNKIEEGDVQGLKIYPQLGFYPDDTALDVVYEYAEKRKLPILAHCSQGGIFSREHFWKNKKRSYVYPDPIHWGRVLEQYPNLYLCLAHAGGDEAWYDFLQKPPVEKVGTTWVSTMMDLLCNPAYKNLYVDVSYTARYHELHPVLQFFVDHKVYGERVLFGSDFYMVQREGSEREFSINLRGNLGEENYKKIAHTNPRRYLRV